MGIHWAALNGHAAVVGFFVDQGVDVDAEDEVNKRVEVMGLLYLVCE